MNNYNDFLKCCDEEKPRIRNAFEIILEKFANQELNKESSHTDFEAFFITFHIGQGLGWLNEDLRNGLKYKTECKTLFSEYLDNSLSKIGSYSGTVYRMDNPIADSEHELKWFRRNTGKCIIIRHYLSTSKDIWNNRPVTWEIETLQNGSYGKDISKLNISEREVLFKRDSRFRIIGINEKTSLVYLKEMEEGTNFDIELIKDYSDFIKKKYE